MQPAHQRAGTNFSGLFDLGRRMSSSSLPVEAGLEDGIVQSIMGETDSFLGNQHQLHQKHVLRCQ